MRWTTIIRCLPAVALLVVCNVAAAPSDAHSLFAETLDVRPSPSERRAVKEHGLEVFVWDNAACDGDPDSPTEAAMKFSGIAANPEGSRWSHPCVTSNQNPPTSFFVETREQLSETHYMVSFFTSVDCTGTAQAYEGVQGTCIHIPALEGPATQTCRNAHSACGGGGVHNTGSAAFTDTWIKIWVNQRQTLTAKAFRRCDLGKCNPYGRWPCTYLDKSDLHMRTWHWKEQEEHKGKVGDEELKALAATADSNATAKLFYTCSELMALCKYPDLYGSWVANNCPQTCRVWPEHCVMPGPESTEYQILLDLYNATDGPNWSWRAGWLGRSSHCTWDGVLCNPDGNVISLLLQENNLKGTIPSTMLGLLWLSDLHLGDNKLRGTIPAEIHQLKRLVFLDITNNGLTGNVPVALQKLSILTQLYLAGNPKLGEEAHSPLEDSDANMWGTR